MKKLCIAAMLVAATAGTASAGGAANSIGVGTELQISGVGGISVNYDTGVFHVGGFLGFADPDGPNNDIFDIGGRFYYHVAKSASADFGVGGALGIESAAGANGRATGVFIEPGFQIRAFITTNVALSFTGGISIGVDDAHDLRIGGNALSSGVNGITGSAGVHYYFF